MLLNYVKNYIKYNPKRSNPENDSSKKIKETRKGIRIGIIIFSIALIVGIVLLNYPLIGEKPSSIIGAALSPCGGFFTIMYVLRYYFEVFNHDCGDNTDEKLLIFNLIADDLFILFILGGIIFFAGFILLLFSQLSKVVLFFVCLLGLGMLVFSLRLADKNHKKLNRSKTNEEKINQVVYSLCESKITTENQFERLDELLKIELKRCGDEQNAIESKIGIIIGCFLGLSGFTALDKISLLNAIIIIIIDLGISCLLLLYYLDKRTRSSYCGCSTEIVYDSLCDLELFMCDPQHKEKISEQMALLDKNLNLKIKKNQTIKIQGRKNL